MQTFVLDEESNSRIVVFLLKNIKNSKTLISKILKGEIDCCAIKPGLIVNSFQILVAADKALRNKQAGKLKTKSLNTELLFNLSISRNITQSLSKFGVSDKEKHFVVVVFEEKNEDKFERMKIHFEGDICDISEISELTDVDLIKKTYKINEIELKVSELLDSVISRISTKEFGFC